MRQQRSETAQLKQAERALGRALAQLEILAMRLDSTAASAGAFGRSSVRRFVDAAKYSAQITKFMDQLCKDVRRHRKNVRTLRRELAFISPPPPVDGPTSEECKRAVKRVFEEALKKAEELGLTREQREEDTILQNEPTAPSRPTVVETAAPDTNRDQYFVDDIDWSVP